MASPRIGTAGWSLPAMVRDIFPAGGSHLARYAARLSAVEINSSFYRPHRSSTYARWAATVGGDFRFAVKLPKTISHVAGWPSAGPEIDRFAQELDGLADKLAIVLIQFPPSRSFDAGPAAGLFDGIANRLACQLVCEPRHRSWFVDEADTLLESRRIARVAADPAILPRAAEPGGYRGVVYRRLHGSPRIYSSDYGQAPLEAIAEAIEREVAAGIESWCIFDNTARGAATGNALTLQSMLLPETQEATA